MRVEDRDGADGPTWRRAWIGLGSNLGRRRSTLEAAIAQLARSPHLEVRRVSSWYETQPVGGPSGQGPYRNGVAELETRLDARALLDLLLEVEKALGRDRSREERNGPRTLDLDLLLMGAERHAEPGLVVPHPRLEDREFVLEPLCELEPHLRLPFSGRRALERLEELRAR